MHPGEKRKNIIEQLQKGILSLQGFRDAGTLNRMPVGLGPIEKAFPRQTFPVAAVHEFLSYAPEETAATNGFITALLSRLMVKDGFCLWIATRRSLYPPALKLFGIEPDRVIFIDAPKAADALWTLEEALKCDAPAAVVGEIPDLSFTDSRRLQLAVESSRVTGLIHRAYPRKENTVACVSRWHIKPAPGQSDDEMPGLGFPRWEVALSKIRNGRPGSWLMEWAGGSFRHIVTNPAPYAQPLQTGSYG